MKRKLIIHVGMGKTGSTSIQKALLSAPQTLEKHGVKYLGLMLENQPLSQEYAWHVIDGWGHYINLPQGKAVEQLVTAFEEIDRSLPESIHTLVWSNESLFSGVQGLIIALEQLKSSYDIDIVGYIRSPDSWIQSAYLQWGIKHKSYTGKQKKFKQWIKNMKFTVTPFLATWHKLGHSASFYNFEHVNDVCQHFLEQHLLDVAAEVQPLRANDTPSAVALALYAYHNSRFTDQVLPNDLQPLLAASGVITRQQQMPPFNNLLPQPSDIEAFIEDNRAEIDGVNSFFRESGQPAFEFSEPRYKDYSVTQLDINRALLQLIVHLSRQVDDLKSQIQAKGK